MWLMYVLTVCLVAGCSGGTVSKSGNSANRLIGQSSPYLKAHAHDPVDWYPWGQEAFAKAKSENKPILLSIGYSACHWCHVMHRESFQDETTAELMNQEFVCIKVDREERPDIDETYMPAVQLISGRGGWPATLFLTPDLKPFFAGTYFPGKEAKGAPSFKQVLTAVKKSWRDNRSAQVSVSTEVVRIIANYSAAERPSSTLGFNIIKEAVDNLSRGLDIVYGGIGPAPKFPVSEPISLCLRLTTAHADQKLRNSSLSIASTTLNGMAMGAINDQVGGGFFRYSTDNRWRTPHFEKMLYDNAMIAQNYLDAYQASGKTNLYWGQTARSTLDFALRELVSPEGAYYSSLDADSADGEGAFYFLSRSDVAISLGKQDSDWFCNAFSVSEKGNYSPNKNVLFLSCLPQVLADGEKLSMKELLTKVSSLKARLFKARSGRQAPSRDEKIITGWNALMISSLVRGRQVLGDDKYLNAARKNARFLATQLYSNHRLQRSWSGNADRSLKIIDNDGFLEDYALLVQAFLDLSAVDNDPLWLRYAQELNQAILDHFSNPADGSLYFSANHQEQLIARPSSSADNSMPSGTAVEIMNLIRLGQITGTGAYRDRADRLLKLYASAMKRDPIAYGSMLKSLDFFLRSKTEIVVVSGPESSNSRELLDAIYANFTPNTLLVHVRSEDAERSSLALLRGKNDVEGQSAVYICHNQSCEKPITTVSALKARLSRLAVAGDL